MNNITIKQLMEMDRKGYDGSTKEEILNAVELAKATKTSFSDIQKRAEDKLQASLEPGEQLSLDFGSDTYSAALVDSEDISFDCSDDDLYNICLTEANKYCKHDIDKAAIKKDYKKGLAPVAVTDHIVITTQTSMKISKKARKED